VLPNQASSVADPLRIAREKTSLTAVRPRAEWRGAGTRRSPSRFKYHLAQESVIIEVEFKEEEEAEIFKQYFDRAKTIWISVGVLGSEL
jgi:hypothetical protein